MKRMTVVVMVVAKTTGKRKDQAMFKKEKRKCYGEYMFFQGEPIFSLDHNKKKNSHPS